MGRKIGFPCGGIDRSHDVARLMVASSNALRHVPLCLADSGTTLAKRYPKLVHCKQSRLEDCNHIHERWKGDGNDGNCRRHIPQPCH